MNDILPLFIGIGLGSFITYEIMRYKLDALHARRHNDILAAKKLGADMARREGIHRSAAPFTSLN